MLDFPIRVNKDNRSNSYCGHLIPKLTLLDSVLTEQFGPDSDADVLVGFHPEHIPGHIAVSGMGRALSQILGRKTDMGTPAIRAGTSATRSLRKPSRTMLFDSDAADGLSKQM